MNNLRECSSKIHDNPTSVPDGKPGGSLDKSDLIFPSAGRMVGNG